MEQKTSYSRVDQRRRKRKQARNKWLVFAMLFIGAVVIVSTVWSNLDNKQTDTAIGAEQNSEQTSPIEDDPIKGSDGPEDSVEPTETVDPGPVEQEDASPEEPTEETDATPSEEDQRKNIKLTFVGDVLLGSTVDNLLTSHGYDYPYEHIMNQFGESDILAANLETPITERGEPENKQYVYRSKPEVLPAFKAAGFDVVTLANNHILDYWHDGLLDTLQYLDEIGIARVGAGKDEEEAYEPAIVHVDGITVAYVGLSRVVPRNEWKATPYQPGVAESYSLERSVDAIQKARQQADLVVVLAHWGTERESEPNEHQISNAHAYIDAGADLVVGSHPHVLQGFEQYKGKWIAYSLGNFIFTTNPDYKETLEGGVLHANCSVDGECELELVPVWNEWARPSPMDQEDRNRVFKRLESDGITIHENGEIR